MSSTGGSHSGVRLYKGGSEITEVRAAGSSNRIYYWLTTGYIETSGTSYNSITAMTGQYLDSPATTSATTYDIRCFNRETGGVWYLNRTQSFGNTSQTANPTSSITLIEIGA